VRTCSTLAALRTVAVWEVAICIETPASALGLVETIPFQEFSLRQHAVVLAAVIQEVVVRLARQHYTRRGTHDNQPWHTPRWRYTRLCNMHVRALHMQRRAHTRT
jgi:hypothetical protein